MLPDQENIDDVAPGRCQRCGGEGCVEYFDAEDKWGEDSPSELNHLIACPDCAGSGRSPL